MDKNICYILESALYDIIDAFNRYYMSSKNYHKFEKIVRNAIERIENTVDDCLENEEGIARILIMTVIENLKAILISQPHIPEGNIVCLSEYLARALMSRIVGLD